MKRKIVALAAVLALVAVISAAPADAVVLDDGSPFGRHPYADPHPRGVIDEIDPFDPVVIVIRLPYTHAPPLVLAF